MSSRESLEEVRGELRRLEEPIVAALVERARFRRNAASLARVAGAAADPRLMRCYEIEIVPSLCAPGEDGRGQESAALDERLLALLAERLLVGVRVADAKAREEPARFARLAAAADRQALLAALTDAATERAVIGRVRALAQRHGGPPEPSVVAAIFARWVIPLTKEIEADRLLEDRGR